METFKIGICEPNDFSEKAMKILSQIGEVSTFDGNELSQFISDKNAIFVRLKYMIDDELIANAKHLLYVCSPTTGLNHVNITNHKIEVLSLKYEYEFLNTIRATPEHIIGLTLSLLRNYSHAFLNSTNTCFDRNKYKGYELYHNRVGIIGFGRVGKIIAKYFLAFEADVYFYDIEKIESDYAKRCGSIEELIEKVDIVILSANYLVDNDGMIGKSQFYLMKDKFFINAARGELVNEIDLLHYLKKNWFRGVAIDVIARETEESSFLNEAIMLTKTNNLIITPHIGGATFNSMARTEEFVAQKLLDKCISMGFTSI